MFLLSMRIRFFRRLEKATDTATGTLTSSKELPTSGMLLNLILSSSTGLRTMLGFPTKPGMKAKRLLMHMAICAYTRQCHAPNHLLSMELPFSSHEHNMNGMSAHRGGGNEDKGVNLLMKGSVKVARGLNLPPMAPLHGGAKGIGTAEVKKAVRKGSGQVEDVHRLRLMYNRHLQWRYANAKAEASMMAQKKQCEKQLYSLAVKLPELRDSVRSKRIEYCRLKGLSTLSTILDAQTPYLDEWSTLDESFSSSLMELSNGLLNVLSQVPLDGNVKADMKEIEEELHLALKATESICLQVQSFMPKAEQVDGLISDLARVSSGEITHINECGDLLSKTHLSQVEECSLRGQVMQLHQYKLKDGQR